MEIRPFTKQYIVNDRTQKATKFLLGQASLNGEDNSKDSLVQDAKGALIEVFDHGMAHEEFRANDFAPRHTFNKYLDCIFRLKPKLAPHEVEDEIPFLGKAAFLKYLFQNIAEAAADTDVIGANVQDALLRVDYFLPWEKDAEGFEYQGKKAHIVFKRDEEQGTKEMKMHLVQPASEQEKPNSRSLASLLSWFKFKPSE